MEQRKGGSTIGEGEVETNDVPQRRGYLKSPREHHARNQAEKGMALCSRLIPDGKRSSFVADKEAGDDQVVPCAAL